MKYTRLVFSFCACLAFSQAFGKAEDDLSVIRQNFNRIYVQSEGEESPLKELLLQNQPGFSVSDRVVMELQQRVPYEAARMRHYLKALQADGSWSDINYQDTNRSGWDPRLHAERILELQQSGKRTLSFEEGGEGHSSGLALLVCPEAGLLELVL